MASRFPIVFELLERREIHLVNIAPLSKLLTDENHRELLGQAGRLSKRELLKYLAQRSPRPDLPSGIRRLPPQAGAASAGPTGSLEPRSATAYRLHLDTSEALKQKLELARDLMSHAKPSGDLSVVVDRALDLLIDRLKARRFGQTKRRAKGFEAATIEPSAARRTAGADRSDLHRSKRKPSSAQQPVRPQQAACPRQAPHPQQAARPQQAVRPPQAARPHVPNETRREVVARDGLRCSYVGSSGCRCTAQGFLELDHEQPWAKGGANTSKNLRVLCRAHNQLLAEQAYGKWHVQAAMRARKRVA